MSFSHSHPGSAIAPSRPNAHWQAPPQLHGSSHPVSAVPNYSRPPPGWVPPGYPDPRSATAKAAAAAAGAAQARPNGQWAQFGHWPMRPPPKPVSREYLSTPLKDNPLGLTGMHE